MDNSLLSAADDFYKGSWSELDAVERMGHYMRVTQAIRRTERRPGRKINQIKRKLERLER